jgi:periplasmic divalent cation tolerance protein
MDGDKRNLEGQVNAELTSLTSLPAVLIYSTFPSVEAAEAEGAKLVEDRLAACVNILPGMTSLYFWEGKLNRDQEAVMIVKTRPSNAKVVTDAIKSRHSYSNPALLIVPVLGGSDAYLQWIQDNAVEPQAG